MKPRGEWVYVYLLLEFQSANEPDMALRIRVYTGLLYQDLIRTGQISAAGPLPPVFPVVLYSGRPRWRAARDVAELLAPSPPGLEAYRPSQRYFLFDEQRVAAAARKAGSEVPNNLVAILVGIEAAKEPGELVSLGKALFALLPARLRSGLAWVKPRLESAGIAQLNRWADDLLDAPSLEALFSDR